MKRATFDKNQTGRPREVPEDILEKQDPDYTAADFDAALERTTKRLADPSERDPGSPRRSRQRRPS
jgi:hypothetical protein